MPDTAHGGVLSAYSARSRRSASGPAPRRSSPSRAAPATGGTSMMHTAASGAGRDPLDDARGEQRVPRGQHAAAEHDRGGQPGQAEPAHGGQRHRADLPAWRLHQLGGDRVTGARDGQEDRGKPRQRVLGDLSRWMPTATSLPRPPRSARPPRRAARCPGRGRPRRASARHSAARPARAPPPQSPVIAPRARNPAGPPVRRDADAVDARPAGDRHAPVRLRRAAGREAPAALGRLPWPGYRGRPAAPRTCR